jgi:hypothetical protein
MLPHIDPDLTKDLEDKQMAKLQQAIDESHRHPKDK